MTRLRQTLVDAASDVLKELQPNIWDTRGYDALRLYIKTWKLEERMEAESLTANDIWRDAILDEKLVNSARYKAYVKSGGMHKPDVMAPEAEAVGTGQASDFIMSGHVYGENISLDSIHGIIHTTTERILSFTKFQQDVLRDTLTVYPGSLKKKHEANVVYWVSRLVKHEKREDDVTLPKNMLADYILDYFNEAISAEDRIERAMSQGRPVLQAGLYYFQLDAFLAWLNKRDKEYRWKKTEIKLYLQEIYGSCFQPNARLNRRWRCLSVEKSHGANTIKEKILNDSGSGQDDSAHHGRDGGDEGGQTAPVVPHPVVLESNGGGSEEPSEEGAGLLDAGGVAHPVE